ncbi:PH domain-containing protein [Natronococcus jeotgali]|uniref:Membrane-flanked domain protein n=1 Tax=Natronococcus jeotgali DSM 18795 TaxID=1227498 RepID=L9WXC8_9EURY|nr:PH domain-containing protein [Natronococcus jeotgali]ELY53856.1 membrane-flanked domain protein [Natronococcus jeotgali DSM 18795]
MNRLHPLSGAATALHRGVAGGSIPFFLVSMLDGVFDAVEVGWVFFLAPVGFVVGVAYGAAYYYRFGYELAADTFDIRSGVLSRRSREIPLRRIQNVDISQGIVQRLLGVAVVRIETAGGGETEAELAFVADDEATRLQREIRRLTAEQHAEAPDARSPETDASSAADRADSTGADPDPRPTLLFDLEGRELLLLSLSSVSLSGATLLPLVFVVAGDAVVDLLVSLAEPLGGPADLDDASAPQYGLFAVVSILYGALAAYLLGAAYTFATYYDFRLGSTGDDLVYERGLLQRYSGSIPVDKIQTFSIAENPIQRAIEYAGLRIETAGHGPDGSAGSQSAVPLARRRRVEGFLERATGLETPSFTRPPTLARRRYVARYSLLAAAVVAAAFGVSRVWTIPYWYASALAFAGAPIAAHLRWRNLGYAVADDHLLVRAGFWRRRTHAIPYYRVQTVSTRRSIFQRRLGLGSVVVDTASSRTFARGTPTIHDLEVTDARAIHEETRARLEAARRSRGAEGRELSVTFS